MFRVKPEVGKYDAQYGLLLLGDKDGKFKKILGTCSHYGSIFGDVLLIGVVVNLQKDLSLMRAGDDVSELNFFDIHKLPTLAFDCHRKIVQYYLNELKN